MVMDTRSERRDGWYYLYLLRRERKAGSNPEVVTHRAELSTLHASERDTASTAASCGIGSQHCP